MLIWAAGQSGRLASTSSTRRSWHSWERLPDLAAGFYDVLFEATTRSLASYLETAWELTGDEAAGVANELIGLTVHPVLPRLLFGIDPLTDALPERDRLTTDVDLDGIRRLLGIVMPSAGLCVDEK